MKVEDPNPRRYILRSPNCDVLWCPQEPHGGHRGVIAHDIDLTTKRAQISYEIVKKLYIKTGKKSTQQWQHMNFQPSPHCSQRLLAFVAKSGSNWGFARPMVGKRK